MASLPAPVRSLAACDALLTAPGSPFKLETVEIGGVRLRAYKALPKSLRALWLGSAVSRFCGAIGGELREGFRIRWEPVGLC